MHYNRTNRLCRSFVKNQVFELTPDCYQALRQSPTITKTCVICLSKHALFITYPCMHLFSCEDCIHEYSAKCQICPVCRAKAEKFMRIFT